MQDQLIDNIAATTGLEPQQVAAQISRPPKLDQGDLAFPCFALAKQRKMSPVECATALAAELELPAGIARAEALGPYLNFFVDRTELTRRTIDTALQQGHEVGSRPAHDECMIVEYSSPNIAKPFHVGHLRTTLIGHSLVQIYRHLGYQVEGINHLGDWGTQFGFVFAGCELWGKPEDPDVDELVEIYKRATALRKAQDSGVVNDEDRDKPDVNPNGT